MPADAPAHRAATPPGPSARSELERLLAEGPLDLDRLAQVSLRGADLRELDLTGADLRGADLSRADLRGASLLGARLAGACLFEAKLNDAELAGADLEGVNLTGAVLDAAGLGRASLRDAQLLRASLRHATLVDADLSGAQLDAAVLASARLRDATLANAGFSHADLANADLQGCKVAGAVFDHAHMQGAHVAGLTGFKRASWVGADLREIDFTGAYLCRAFILDQNFLTEFRAQSRWHEALYFAWWVTSDCGRSITRWAAWTGILVLGFAWAYTVVDVDFGAYATPISPLYFSVVTLTTLGYGDVHPAGPAAQVVAMLEVMTGYLMLGGLLSIFSKKMASRAD